MKKVLYAVVVLTLLNFSLQAQTSLLATASFNPAFESGTLSLWSMTTSKAATATQTAAACTIAATTTDPQSGTTCAQATVTATPTTIPGGVATNADALQLRTSNYFTITANTAYTYRFWAKSDVAGKKINAYITDGGGIRPTTRSGMDNIVLTTSWAQYTATFTHGSAGTYRPMFQLAHNTGTFYFDNLEVFETSTLPIELAKFDVKRNQTAALLTWTAASEKDNATFNIEQSTNGADFQTVGQVKGRGTTSAATNYNFEHSTPSVGINYYRLKQVDFDGTATYSAVRSLVFDKNGLVVKTTLVHDALDVVVNDETTTPLSIFNSAGQQVLNSKAQGAQRLDVSHLPVGLYLIRTATGDVGRFVKQ